MALDFDPKAVRAFALLLEAAEHIDETQKLSGLVKMFPALNMARGILLSVADEFAEMNGYSVYELKKALGLK